MTAPDRTIAPVLGNIKAFDLHKPEMHTLKNGVPLYILDAGTQDLLKIELVFNAGSRFENKPLQSGITAAMLSEGTKSRTASQIADEIDSYGAFFSSEADKDKSSVTLYTLSRYIKETLAVVLDMVTNATFPEEEFLLYRKNAAQRFLINSERLDFVAKKCFNEMLFGNDHPYGHNVSKEDYENITAEDLRSFYKQFYNTSQLYIIVSGKTPDNIFESFESSIGLLPSSEENAVGNHIDFEFKANKKLIEKQEALQSVIVIGCPTINRTDPDFPGLQVVNSILGGYFGSRLMSNIREDKGYTYGIGSAVVSLNQSGYFYITTEVGAEVCSKALNEIYFELSRLSEELISEEELQLVKSYLYGVFLRSVDGPIALSEKLRVVLDSGLNLEYYQKYLNEIKTITPRRVQTLVQKYLTKERLSELVVGKL